MYFSQEKLFLFLGKGSPEKTSYILLKESFSYISGKANPEKFIYISGNGDPEKLFIFQEVTLKAQK